eukprot:TRINITY_DN8131_c0_g1_i1.p1 TRINITY_DN8131_c0_g1~~TRINITY_DN8131_c0_g1_i1.p1  ORF type:complete len:809 (-),score=347.19 TRINITY_DN8131_c0_g1_i1:36-2462(-)
MEPVDEERVMPDSDGSYARGGRPGPLQVPRPSSDDEGDPFNNTTGSSAFGSTLNSLSSEMRKLMSPSVTPSAAHRPSSSPVREAMAQLKGSKETMSKKEGMLAGMICGSLKKKLDVVVTQVDAIDKAVVELQAGLTAALEAIGSTAKSDEIGQNLDTLQQQVMFLVQVQSDTKRQVDNETKIRVDRETAEAEELAAQEAEEAAEEERQKAEAEQEAEEARQAKEAAERAVRAAEEQRLAAEEQAKREDAAAKQAAEALAKRAAEEQAAIDAEKAAAEEERRAEEEGDEEAKAAAAAKKKEARAAFAVAKAAAKFAKNAAASAQRKQEAARKAAEEKAALEQQAALEAAAKKKEEEAAQRQVARRAAGSKEAPRKTQVGARGTQRIGGPADPQTETDLKDLKKQQGAMLFRLDVIENVQTTKLAALERDVQELKKVAEAQGHEVSNVEEQVKDFSAKHDELAAKYSTEVKALTESADANKRNAAAALERAASAGDRLENDVSGLACLIRCSRDGLQNLGLEVRKLEDGDPDAASRPSSPSSRALSASRRLKRQEDAVKRFMEGEGLSGSRSGLLGDSGGTGDDEEFDDLVKKVNIILEGIVEKADCVETDELRADMKALEGRMDDLRQTLGQMLSIEEGQKVKGDVRETLDGFSNRLSELHKEIAIRATPEDLQELREAADRFRKEISIIQRTIPEKVGTKQLQGLIDAMKMLRTQMSSVETNMAKKLDVADFETHADAFSSSSATWRATPSGTATGFFPDGVEGEDSPEGKKVKKSSSARSLKRTKSSSDVGSKKKETSRSLSPKPKK